MYKNGSLETIFLKVLKLFLLNLRSDSFDCDFGLFMTLYLLNCVRAIEKNGFLSTGALEIALFFSLEKYLLQLQKSRFALFVFLFKSAF